MHTSGRWGKGSALDALPAPRGADATSFDADTNAKIASVLATSGSASGSGLAGLIDSEAAAAAVALAGSGPMAVTGDCASHTVLARGQPLFGVDEAWRSCCAGDQHLALLRFLCDEVLDTQLLRECLSTRIDTAGDRSAELRAEMAEER